VKPWQKVRAGDQLGLLVNPDLDLEIAELKAQLDEQKAEAETLSAELFHTRSETAARELPEIKRAIQSFEEQLAQKREDRGRLRLVARSDGTVLPPRNVQEEKSSRGKLQTWSGSLLDAENLGAYIGGALFCQIGDPRQWEASLVIDQDSIEFVHENQEVAIKLDGMPGRTFYSTIEEIGPEMEFASRQMSSSGGGDLMSKSDGTGTERPINTSYQARAPIADPDGQLIEGLRGRAKVHAQWQPIGRRFWRYLMRTFNFTL
jgi:hypothetical protein